MSCSLGSCSVACFKEHKGTYDFTSSAVVVSSGGSGSSLEPTELEPQTSASEAKAPPQNDQPLSDPPVLRPLTSLKWPYVPEESAYPDPLKRDDPKVLQLHQYEAIATSPAIRAILSKHKNLPELLTSIDKLRGHDREEALQKALGVTPQDVSDIQSRKELDEDTKALRELAEAIERAVRGDNEQALGLNWGDE
ncbi:hypothetical protein NMY22_g19813 [Coprinellus aureogranulatus]|nr:hypothetical protein NMY22_g19813 [Coprinellus aureogranulatus]